MAVIYSRILVTGSGGFVAPYLLASLGQRFPGARLIRSCFDRGGLRAGDLMLDIRDGEAVDRAISEFSPDGVVHLAAISQVQEAQRSLRVTFETNVGGAINLIEAICRHAPHAKLLYVSSAEVYGATFLTTQEPLNEAASLDPMNAYAASKAAAELSITAMARHGLHAIRVRPFNHIGPGQSDRFVVASFVAQIVKIERGAQERLLRVGNLDAKRDFLDVRDVASAYAEVMAASTLENGAALNIASGEARRVGDILESLLKQAKVAIKVAQDPARLRAVDIPVAVGDAALAKRLLNWEPKIPFEQTLRDMLEAQRAVFA